MSAITQIIRKAENLLPQMLLQLNEIISIEFQKKVLKHMKADGSYVTNIDYISHNEIHFTLHTHFPEIPVISEETYSALNQKHLGEDSNQVWWLVDPIDGTSAMCQGRQDFTTNVALMKGNKALLGFIGHPAKDEVYYGGPALGCKKITNTSHSACGGSVIDNKNSRGHNSPRVVYSTSADANVIQTIIDTLYPSATYLPLSSSLKFLMVADHQADIYVRTHPTKIWDTAAGQAIVEGCNGTVLNITELKPLTYSTSQLTNPFFLAHSSQFIVEELLSRLQQHVIAS